MGPHARTLNMMKKTYLFEPIIGFKKNSWAFCEKMHFGKSIFSFQRLLGFKKYSQEVKFNSGQLLFSLPN